MVTKVNSLLGRVLQTLQVQGLMQNSVVLFTSDNGDFAGQYGPVEKWDTCLNDCILHMPFILWSPELPHGTRVQGLSKHVDLVPTLLELLDLQKPPDWELHGDAPALMRIVLGLQQSLIEWCLRTDTDRPYQPQVGA